MPRSCSFISVVAICMQVCTQRVQHATVRVTGVRGIVSVVIPDCIMLQRSLRGGSDTQQASTDTALVLQQVRQPNRRIPRIRVSPRTA